MNNKKFFLTKSDFHRINEIVSIRDKTFEVIIGSKSFFFSKEQLFLLSPSIFFRLIKSSFPFVVQLPTHIESENSLIDCFFELYSLLTSSNQIEINIQNVIVYKFFSEVLQNKPLELACSNVTSSQSSYFFLSSEHFLFLPSNNIVSFYDLRIQFTSEISIKCNSVFARIISKKIDSIFRNSGDINFIDFSNLDFSHILVSIFDLFKGYPIYLNQFPHNELLNAINFLQFDSLSSFLTLYSFDCPNSLSSFAAQNFSQFSDQYYHFPFNTIEEILLSAQLRLKNENQLFDFIFRKIQEEPTNIYFFKYIFLPSVLKSKIELSPEIFNLNHLDLFKNCFKHGYLISQESQIQLLLCFPPILSNLVHIENENLKLQSILTSLPELILPPLHPDIIEGMNLLRQDWKNMRINSKPLICLKIMQIWKILKLLGE